MEIMYLEKLILFLSIFGGTRAIKCYKCVYDASEPESASVYSAVSLSNKPNTASCGDDWWSRSSNLETCGFLTRRCSAIRFTKSDGHQYVSRGCTTSLSCHNSTQSLHIFGTTYEADFFCCSHSRCNSATTTTTCFSALIFILTLTLVFVY